MKYCNHLTGGYLELKWEWAELSAKKTQISFDSLINDWRPRFANPLKSILGIQILPDFALRFKEFVREPLVIANNSQIFLAGLVPVYAWRDIQPCGGLFGSGRYGEPSLRLDPPGGDGDS